MLDLTRIATALREAHAANNSYRRAWAEFYEAAKGLLVLQQCPGDKGLYWSFDAREVDHTFMGVHDSKADGLPREAVIVDVPPPTAEFLPRMGIDGSWGVPVERTADAS